MSQEEEFSHTGLQNSFEEIDLARNFVQYDLEAGHDTIKETIAKQLSARARATLDDILHAFDNEVEMGIKRLLVAVNKLQRFARKPQKAIIEIFPDSTYSRRFTDV
jgi:hypothetical protein